MIDDMRDVRLNGKRYAAGICDMRDVRLGWVICAMREWMMLDVQQR